jgi:ABC-type transporter Mla subunit MlaD
LLGVLQAQTEALAALPGTLTQLNKTIRGLADAMSQARETAATVQRLASRLETVLDEIEAPMKALAPGLARLATVLDDPAITDLPASLRKLQDDAVPLITGMRETHATVAASAERIAAFVDDASVRINALPGASLLRRRSTARPPMPDPPVAEPDLGDEVSPT